MNGWLVVSGTNCKCQDMTHDGTQIADPDLTTKISGFIPLNIFRDKGWFSCTKQSMPSMCDGTACWKHTYLFFNNKEITESERCLFYKTSASTVMPFDNNCEVGW